MGQGALSLNARGESPAVQQNIVQTLTHAVRARRCVALRYHGQRGLRVVEPHAVYSDEHSQLMLDGYQIRGFSSSGRPPPFWRPFRIKKIAEVELLPQTFAPRTAEGFSAARLRYKHGVIAIVQAPQPAAPPAEAALMEVGPPRPPHLRRPG